MKISSWQIWHPWPRKLEPPARSPTVSRLVGPGFSRELLDAGICALPTRCEASFYHQRSLASPPPPPRHLPGTLVIGHHSRYYHCCHWALRGPLHCQGQICPIPAARSFNEFPLGFCFILSVGFSHGIRLRKNAFRKRQNTWLT